MQELIITDTARSQMNDLLARNQSDRLFLAVLNEGCGGHKFALSLTGASSEHQVALEQGWLMIEASAAPWINQLTIDHPGAGFRFQHGEHRSCGCGQSFIVKHGSR